MSETVEVPFEGKVGDQATLLLAAAEELDLPASVVRTGSGKFLVPAEVEKKAFGSRKGSDDGDDGKTRRTGKKAAAKKSASDDKKEQE